MKYVPQKPMEGRKASALIGLKFQAYENWLTPGAYRALDLSKEDPIMRDAKGIPLEFDSLESVTAWLENFAKTGKRPPMPVFQNRATRDLPVLTVECGKTHVTFIGAERPPDGGIRVALIKMSADDFAQVYIPSPDDEKLIARQWADHALTLGASPDVIKSWERFFPGMEAPKMSTTVTPPKPKPSPAAPAGPPGRTPPRPPGTPAASPRPVPPRPVPPRPVPPRPAGFTPGARPAHVGARAPAAPPARVAAPFAIKPPLAKKTAPTAPVKAIPTTLDERRAIHAPRSNADRKHPIRILPPLSATDYKRYLKLATGAGVITADIAAAARAAGIENAQQDLVIGKRDDHSSMAREMLLLGVFSDDEIDHETQEAFEGVYKNFAATQRSQLKKRYGIFCPRIVRAGP
jgi:hypothetical protein